MARRIKIESGILNVKVHPHSAERYANLIKATYARKNIAKIRGDRYAMLSLLDTRTVPQGYVSGLLTTFVNIELDGNWFDTESLSVSFKNVVKDKPSIALRYHITAFTQ